MSQIQEKLSILPDYDFKSQKENGTSASGIIGAGITFCLALGAGGIITYVKKKKNK